MRRHTQRQPNEKDVTSNHLDIPKNNVEDLDVTLPIYEAKPYKRPSRSKTTVAQLTTKKLKILPEIHESPQIETQFQIKRCFICRSAQFPNIYVRGTQVEDNSRFTIYSTLVKLLNFNHGLPNSDHIEKELRFCCTTCFEAVDLVWTFQQQINTIQLRMNQVIEQIRLAITLKTNVTLEDLSNENHDSLEKPTHVWSENEATKYTSKKIRTLTPFAKPLSQTMFPSKSKKLKVKSNMETQIKAENVSPGKKQTKNLDRVQNQILSSDVTPTLRRPKIKLSRNLFKNGQQKQQQTKRSQICESEEQGSTKEDGIKIKSSGDFYESDEDSDFMPSTWRPTPTPTKSKKSTQKKMKQNIIEQIETPVKTENIFTCDLCPLTFAETQSMKRHKQQAHEVKIPRHLCPICNCGFSRKNDRDVHLQLHSVRELSHRKDEEKNKSDDLGEKPVIRDFKSISAKNAKSLTRGRPKKLLMSSQGSNTSSDVSNAKSCDILKPKQPKMLLMSSQGSNTSSDLSDTKICDNDKLKPQTTEEPTLKCKLCPTLLFTRKTLLNHNKIFHKYIRSHVCSLCGFKTYKRSDLRKHELCHSSLPQHSEVQNFAKKIYVNNVKENLKSATKAFETKRALNFKRRSLSLVRRNNNELKCWKCSKPFPQKYSLHFHVQFGNCHKARE